MSANTRALAIVLGGSGPPHSPSDAPLLQGYAVFRVNYALLTVCLTGGGVLADVE
jgi:hypothetical protein